MICSLADSEEVGIPSSLGLLASFLPCPAFWTGNPGHPLAPVEKLPEWKGFETILAIFSRPLLFLFERSPVLPPLSTVLLEFSQWRGP